MSDSVELRSSPGRGVGVFALQKFRASETVIVGVIEQRLLRNSSHASQIGLNSFVLHNRLVRLVNHSCEPNCGIKVNNTGAHDYVAMRDIDVGEEILFDYAMRNYKVEHFPKQCLCGSSTCRRHITGWIGLPAEKKREYRRFAAPYLLDLERSDCGGSTTESSVSTAVFERELDASAN